MSTQSPEEYYNGMRDEILSRWERILKPPPTDLESLRRPWPSDMTDVDEMHPFARIFWEKTVTQLMGGWEPGSDAQKIFMRAQAQDLVNWTVEKRPDVFETQVKAMMEVMSTLPNEALKGKETVVTETREESEQVAQEAP